MHAKKGHAIKSETAIGGVMLAAGVALTALGITAEVGVPLTLIGGYIVAKGQGVRL